MSAPGIGHNRSPFQRVEDAVESLQTEAENWFDGTPLETQGQADAIATMINQARAAKKDAAAEKKIEEAPHNEAKKNIAERYSPLTEALDTILEDALALLEPYLLEQERQRLREVEIAAQKADEARRRAETAAIYDDAPAVDAALSDMRHADYAAKAVASTKAKAKGQGRSIGLRSRQVVTIKSYKELLAYYLDTQPKAIHDFLEGMAKKDVKAGGQDIPGVEVETTKVV